MLTIFRKTARLRPRHAACDVHSALSDLCADLVFTVRLDQREAYVYVLLLRQLTKKFGPLPPEIETRVRSAAVPELEDWAERVLDAQTLDGVFES